MKQGFSPLPFPDMGMQFEGFDNLMPFRVQEIMLVSSLYDSFILREDGRLNELLISESQDLHLQQIPRITHVSSCREALALAKSEPRFNLILTNLAVGDMNAAQLAHDIKAAGLQVPVVVLAYDYRELKRFVARNPASEIDRVFLWQGTPRLLLAIVKYIEDKRNVEHDTSAMGVQVVLVIEDNIRYYSAFLPLMYTELISQTRRVIQEGLNLAHKLMRMRARPKILLTSNFEEAYALAVKYQEHLLGVVSDVEFPHGGVSSAEAGFELARSVRALVPDVPIVLQTSRTAFRQQAYAEGYSFLRKRSPTFLRDLRKLLTQEFAFGDFVFRTPDKAEVGRATDLNSLEELLHTAPTESLAYHAQRNHFSHWLTARTEFALAQKLRPRKVSDFPTVDDLRRNLIDSIAEYRREQSGVLIGDFKPAAFQSGGPYFLRIGSGSLGGKARGLAFVRHLLHKRQFTRRFPNVRVSVPPTAVIATDAFDKFLAENNLLDFAINATDDSEIQQRFLDASLPGYLVEDLRAFLAEAHYPLAVRSSSLLEDSQYQPFTGVYETYMLGNQQEDDSFRLNQLSEAIKLVYASTFSRHAKAYVRATPFRLEEEKMAVILQQVVGSFFGQRFYPDFSGVARSRNFYPVPPMTFEDGVAAVALGLGRTVVDGGKCLTFCPRYPANLVQFSTVEDVLSESQTDFWGLSLNHPSEQTSPPGLREVRFGLNVAEEDGTLEAVGSTYSADNDRITDGLARPGVRLVTFAPVLKYGAFPLASLLDVLVKEGEHAFGQPVEIEFAVRLPRQPQEAADFGFLQIRPLVLSRETEELQMDGFDPSRIIAQSSKVLGNGRVGNLQDVVVVDSQRFERGQSQEVARQVAYFNARLTSENRPYLLFGVGRWGSNDPWLGIPVEWDEISGARVIVETGFRDFRVTPSQGSHFFQNLSAFQVGYFTVNPDLGEGMVDWEWLAAQPALEERGCVRHLRFADPITVLMNAHSGVGMILKPDGNPSGR
ncbi:MAG TPA: PEP/pyruvate-binding domain-containing protein [Candidatus Limnocylindrales bacterium]|nr:PEP/pyruvate-binding domain-containing protein [Candidatus Limnocylindrales bacterium]